MWNYELTALALFAYTPNQQQRQQMQCAPAVWFACSTTFVSHSCDINGSYLHTLCGRWKTTKVSSFRHFHTRNVHNIEIYKWNGNLSPLYSLGAPNKEMSKTTAAKINRNLISRVINLCAAAAATLHLCSVAYSVRYTGHNAWHWIWLAAVWLIKAQHVSAYIWASFLIWMRM